jgi:hypothetical protein
MNGQLNGALKSSEFDGHKDASVIRKRKPSSDKSAFGAVFSTTARYEPLSDSPSPSDNSLFQSLHLPEPIPKLPTKSTTPISTMNIIGVLDGHIKPLQVLDIPSSFGNRMAPLNISKLFENKLPAPDISKIFAGNLALPDLSKSFRGNLVPISIPDAPNLSRLLAAVSGIIRILVGLSTAIVERLLLAITKILAQKLLPLSIPRPPTTLVDVWKPFLPDVLPTANDFTLFDGSPARLLKTGPTPLRFWQLVGQSGQLFGRRTCWLNLPRWLLVPLLPIFPLGGAVYFSLKFLSILAKFVSTMARILLTLTKFWRAYIASPINIVQLAIELWQVYGLITSLSLLLL